ncbi:hypothetical protein D3C72_1495500 [compost metagenome]
MQALVAECLVSLQTVHAGLGKTVLPVAERAFRDGKQRCAHFAGAGTTTGNVRERKIGHDGAGRADLIAIIEMVDIRCIEIDRLLHPAQAERIGEKVVVLARTTGHGGDVVQALDLVQHDKPLFALAARQSGQPCSWREDGVRSAAGIDRQQERIVPDW